MSGLVSDEVAEDYKSSLEDLTGNDRFQISNLTVIAKENTEHAMAISRVLENHIRSTPPPQKLPALYVVDSIVKNVGTPYTLFLGRNLYQTFMNAYTLVDAQTRRKLDEMLKTWKEPVPGSLDTRPVFPPEITRSIESALIKARTAALQQEQARNNMLNRGRGGTPAAMARPGTTHPHHHGGNGQGNRTMTPPSGHRPGNDLDALNRDLEACILAARNDFASAPFDPTTQQRLKALLDLQTIMRNQQLTPDQLRLVQDQISAFRPQSSSTSYAAPHAPSAPSHNSSAAISTPLAAAPVAPVAATPTPPQQPVSQSLQNLLNSRTLAELIKNTAIRQQPTPPPAMPQMPQLPQVPPPMPSTGSSTPLPDNPLIAALRSRGILPPASAPPTMGQPPAGKGEALPFLIPGGMRSTPSAPTPISMAASSVVPMTTASMKIPRVALVVSLYEAKSNRCGTCGRRFPANQEGKEKKARHLDWHFKTNQRMSEAAKRAQTRSWYVDERDWIKSREVDDDQPVGEGETHPDGETGATGANSKPGPPKAWIRAPNDATRRNTPCPICQEKFESTWSEDVQDWIWQDAIQVGTRVYHASCYAEVTKGGPVPRSSTPQAQVQARTGTPDSVLGKRKAEATDSPGKTRIKTEG
ncbi:hypothetical protein POX_e06392 [Penicillium oxalicum]|uniref:hypothetical protein n=1 Tax=Penicillium oxalicum TaxID=69781 RepID=UPI0020B6CB3E|nr:hypothetical protein POX_e06392 [Penicillium oxalicum]KAI2788377.1 hypothetical protein POX_e06392 [Penicillium oxalicum]